jgi:hypothetical protein
MSRQFETLRASHLYCNKCKASREVREKLLLILPDKEVFDYLCVECGTSVGSREVTVGDIHQQQVAAKLHAERTRRAAAMLKRMPAPPR